jgi:hypothetical protein
MAIFSASDRTTSTPSVRQFIGSIVVNPYHLSAEHFPEKWAPAFRRKCET